MHVMNITLQYNIHGNKSPHGQSLPQKTMYQYTVLSEDLQTTTVFLNIKTKSIIHLENNHKKINTLEEIEILKAASSKYLLNVVIAGQNDPIYKLLP